MALSDVDIVNIALVALKARPITSLDDKNNNGSVSNQTYEPCRDAVLRAYPWNCAMERTSLSASATAPSWGFARQFPLPEGPKPVPRCLRVYEIDGERCRSGIKYKIERRWIRTNQPSPLNILYIAQLEDPAQYDPLLVQAIAARFQSQIAYAITGSAAVASEARQAYRDILAEARSADAQEGSSDELEADDWVESRF